MTNQEIVEAFPECERIRKADMAVCVERVFLDVKFYNEIGQYLMDSCKKFWPEPTNWREDRTQWDIWSNYFYGDYEKKDFRFPDWRKMIETEFLARHGWHRTYEEACRVAADEWVRMIFGRHTQDNGDTSSDGMFFNMLATMTKDQASGHYGEDVKDRFRENILQYYLGHCYYKDEDGSVYHDTPSCDYDPSHSLRKALSDAGCNDSDVSMMCPIKTSIYIDEADNSVCVRGYQKHRYI